LPWDPLWAQPRHYLLFLYNYSIIQENILIQCTWKNSKRSFAMKLMSASLASNNQAQYLIFCHTYSLEWFKSSGPNSKHFKHQGQVLQGSKVFKALFQIIQSNIRDLFTTIQEITQKFWFNIQTSWCSEQNIARTPTPGNLLPTLSSQYLLLLNNYFSQSHECFIIQFLTSRWREKLSLKKWQCFLSVFFFWKNLSKEKKTILEKLFLFSLKLSLISEQKKSPFSLYHYLKSFQSLTKVRNFLSFLNFELKNFLEKNGKFFFTEDMVSAYLCKQSNPDNYKNSNLDITMWRTLVQYAMRWYLITLNFLGNKNLFLFFVVF